MIVSLLGLAPAGHAHDVHADLPESLAPIDDGLCGDGSEHGPCQLLMSGAQSPPVLPPAAGSSRMRILPALASGRSLAPQQPPPRTLP